MLQFNFSKEPVLVCKDHSVSGERFELRRDSNFDLLATFPRPDEEHLPEYYKSENYISHTDSCQSIFDRAYQLVKNFMLRKKIKWVESFKIGKGTILDIGAGTGAFLVEAKKRGWKVAGVEPNPQARTLAKQKEIDLQEKSEHLASAGYDVITMWHVLEHVPDLEKQILELDRLLKEDGQLVVAVPNFKSYDAKYYKSDWAAYDVPRHLYHFSQSAVEKVFAEFDFEVVDRKPLLFDSFYVSLLSEKYKKRKQANLRGLFAGMMSNIKAKQSGEYSSITYFLKKTQRT